MYGMARYGTAERKLFRCLSLECRTWCSAVATPKTSCSKDGDLTATCPTKEDYRCCNRTRADYRTD